MCSYQYLQKKKLLESIKLISKVFKNDNWTLNVIGWSKKNFIEVYFNESNIDAKILERELNF